MIFASRVDVFPGRMRVRVSLAEGAPRFVDSRLANEAVAAYPTLPLHSCINSKGPTFGDVIEGTSVPHLLEHLVIAEQIRLSEERDTCGSTFVGTTEWASDANDDARDEAIVEVSFVDDLIAVEALSRALDFLNQHNAP